MQLGPRVIFSIGSVYVTETVCFVFILSVLMVIFAAIATRNLERIPRGAQNVAEILVEFVYKMVKDVMGDVSEKFAPYIGTLVTLLAVGSMLGILDLRPVTADLNCTAPLAAVTFVMIHYNAIKVQTARGYLRELSSPMAFMLPLNIISDTMFPITLACRIFGNILAGVIIMGLVYSGLHSLSMLLAPIPIFQIAIPLPLNFWFDMFEPVLQAYIFVTLTMVFIDNGRHPSED